MKPMRNTVLAQPTNSRLRYFRQVPATVAAFIAEIVVGATLGAAPAVAGYFKRIREICDRYDVLLILDEIMCGLGRTGTLHASEQDGIAPDLMILAKGLGAGFQPIGAMLVAEKVYEAIATGSGSFNHGHTYMGHAVGCAAALAVQQVIRDEELLANVRRQGETLAHSLQERFGDHPHVGDIRGRGLFRAIELVDDRATKLPFGANLKLHLQIKHQAMSQGLICYPSGGTADGVSGDHVLIAPPALQRHCGSVPGNRGAPCRRGGRRATRRRTVKESDLLWQRNGQLTGYNFHSRQITDCTGCDDQPFLLALLERMQIATLEVNHRLQALARLE
jgi:adenosylmethionine-8-amino-7-oxononanoate aminotransferase